MLVGDFIDRIVSIWLIIALVVDGRPRKHDIPRITNKRTLRRMRRLSRALMSLSKRTPNLLSNTILSDSQKYVHHLPLNGAMMDDISSFGKGDPDIAFTVLKEMMGLGKNQPVSASQMINIKPSRILPHSLYCKNGLFLEIQDNGTVRGTYNYRENKRSK